MAHIIDYRLAHTLAEDVAELSDLAESARVTRLPPSASREDLVGRVVRFLPADALRSERIAVVHTGQARDDERSFFGPTSNDLLDLGFADIMVSSACASGVEALSLANDLVDSGTFDRAIVIAVSSSSRGDWVSFSGVGALASGDVRPLDERSTGVVLGTVAGAVLVAADPAPMSLEIVGTGSRVTGSGAASIARDQLAVMRQAAEQLAPDVVVAHATGTVQGDREELDAIAELTKDDGKHAVRVVSQKGALGHTVQAAGIAAVIGVAEAVRRGRMLGSFGLGRPIPSAGEVVLPLEGESFAVDLDTIFLVNGFGFGGNNFALAVTGSGDLWKGKNS
ncbi:MAG: beta-ketoacyl synthase N-terminal-like domain-containing protein [Microbacterium sp.]